MLLASGEEELSARLLKVVVDAWGRAPDVRRRLFFLLLSFWRARPEVAARALPPDVLLPLLGAALPGDQVEALPGRRPS